MATIQSAIAMSNVSSSSLNSINAVMHGALESIQIVKASIGTAFHMKIEQAMTSTILIAEETFNRVTESIEKAEEHQEKLNDLVDESKEKVDSLGSRFKEALGKVDWKKGLQTFMDTADYFSDIRTKVSFISDGKDSEQVSQMLYNSAGRTRKSSSDMAELVSLFNGGNFSNAEEQIGFTELLAKALESNGNSDPSEKMNAIASAMDSGQISGDLVSTLIKDIPEIGNAMSSTLGVSTQDLMGMADVGEISAQALKNAMFQSSGAIEEKFSQLPITFTQIASIFRNTVEKQIYPAFAKFGEWMNSEQGASTISTIASLLGQVAMLVGWVAEKALAVAGFFANNWQVIAPIILGVATALGLYNMYTMISGLMAKISEQSLWGLVKGLFMQKTATEASAAAQTGLNAALFSCPITWIVLAIIALVAVVYSVVAAINKFTGSTISATGVIVGSFMFLLAVIGNILIAIVNFFIDRFAFIWNYIAIFVEFFGNVFNDPVGAIMHLFSNLACHVLDAIGLITNAIDTIFKTNFGDTIDKWKKDIKSTTDDLYGEQEFKVKRLDSDNFKFDSFDYGDAYNKGYEMGEGIDEKFKESGLFGNSTSSADYEKYLEGIDKNTYGTEGNTARMTDSLDLSNESIAYIRDLAEQEVVNRFTTSEIKVEMSNQFGDIKETVDLDSMVQHLETRLNESLATNVEGVYV